MLRALTRASLCVRLTALPSGASSAPALPLACRGYSAITRRRRKEMRKTAATSKREVLAFARLFDPLRTARAQVFQTLEYMGWECLAGEQVGEGLVVDFTFLDTFVAVEVVEGGAYVLPGAAEASTDMGFGPGATSPVAGQATPHAAAAAAAAAAAVAATVGGKLARVTTPAQTAFAAAPPSWLSPVKGLFLDKATAARHEAIRAKGWKLVVVPEPLWAFAASKRKDAHYARRDLLMSLVLPLIPFEPRPENSLRGAARKTKAGPAAAGEAAAALAGLRKAAIASGAGGGGTLQ